MFLFLSSLCCLAEKNITHHSIKPSTQCSRARERWMDADMTMTMTMASASSQKKVYLNKKTTKCSYTFWSSRQFDSCGSASSSSARRDSLPPPLCTTTTTTTHVRLCWLGRPLRRFFFALTILGELNQIILKKEQKKFNYMMSRFELLSRFWVILERDWRGIIIIATWERRRWLDMMEILHSLHAHHRENSYKWNMRNHKSCFMFTDSKHHCRFEEDGTDGALKLSQINEHNSSSKLKLRLQLHKLSTFCSLTTSFGLSGMPDRREIEMSWRKKG